MDLSGRKVLVTGANRGLGAAFVVAALDRGAAVVYAGVRDPASLDGRPEVVDGRVVPVPLDVSVPAQVAAAAREFADVDLLVSNAGVPCIMTVLDAPDDKAFRDTFEVNFFGPMDLVRAYAPVLRQRAGGVVFVLSVAALGLSRSSPVYSASKAASLMVAQSVRAQLAPDGVTVTVALPGFIDTEMSAGFGAPKAAPSTIAERTLDAWLAGHETVWPDRFAELVREAIGSDMVDMVVDPVTVMNGLHKRFAEDPAAGS